VIFDLAIIQSLDKKKKKEFKLMRIQKLYILHIIYHLTYTKHIHAHYILLRK